MSDPERAKLGARFEEALTRASQLHATQKKKGTEVPYVAHLLGVTSIVLEDGGDEDHAIAALLHDAIEDQGLEESEIERRFGARVREIVVGCTDAFEQPKPPWRARKEKYLAHLRDASEDVLRVSAADKLHNARQIVADVRHLGPVVWERFKGGREGSLWYYRSLAEIFRVRRPGPLTAELCRVVAEMERISAEACPASDN